jgi:RimJ/RimL family protein N-acetyltransferase
MIGPTLTGPRIRLRAPRPGDVASFSRWFADPEIVRYWWMGDVPWARQPRIAALRVLLGALFLPSAIVWTIEREGRPIGHCHIRQIDRVNGHASTALFIGERTQHGQGIAQEAIALRSEFAFRTLRLHKLKTSTQAMNEAGRRMLEKSGYRLVGSAREDAHIDGERRDVLLFELLREDYERQRSTGTS